MLIAEEMRGRERIDVKIFATDTADRSLALARAGVYPGGIEGGHLAASGSSASSTRTSTPIASRRRSATWWCSRRRTCCATRRSRASTSCTCRNLLIYLEPETQRRVLSLLHFALRDGGYLFLGNTESYRGSEHLFEVISKKWRIYRRTGIAPASRLDGLPSFPHAFDERLGAAARVAGRSSRSHAPSATLVLQRALLERYGPPTVVVDRSDQIVYFHGATDPFLRASGGRADARSPAARARGSCALAVRTALRTAVRENRAPRRSLPTRRRPATDPHGRGDGRAGHRRASRRNTSS